MIIVPVLTFSQTEALAFYCGIMTCSENMLWDKEHHQLSEKKKNSPVNLVESQISQCKTGKYKESTEWLSIFPEKNAIGE